MRGYNVIFPMGFDAFGLPAENAAIKRHIQPRDWTLNNIARMQRQLRCMGASFDWTREVVTCLPDYYRWTQWLFLQFYKHDLAYRTKAPANWCPNDNTMLANEQVVDGRCERCDTLVERREIDQWFFRITKYAEELLRFYGLDWPEKTTPMQTNWIGRSEGAEVRFTASIPKENRSAASARPSRSPSSPPGPTRSTVSPSSSWRRSIPWWRSSPRRSSARLWARTSSGAARDRDRAPVRRARAKTGVFTGSYVTNPFNGKKVPIWIADYVLMRYGTGAVMGVPATTSATSSSRAPSTCPSSRSSRTATSLTDPATWAEARPPTARWSTPARSTARRTKKPFPPSSRGWRSTSVGHGAVNYRLRDWLICRQRFWGAPIPIIYCPDHGTVPVPESSCP